MAGIKMELTLEAASATVDFLSDRDSVGVIAFDSEAYPVVSITRVEDKKAIIRQIESIQPLGGTNLYPGLRMAREWLQAVDAQIKHIIVLSDGRSEVGDFRAIARAIRDEGMTLSAVGVGDDADIPMLKMLSDIGGGRFYAADRPENLPRIFTREAALASRSTIIEEPFTPRPVRPAQATNGIDWATVPQLGGYVGTAERDTLTSPAITALVSHKDDPVYAVWQYGLGRSAAFTSDAKPKWAAGWMNWPGFGQFWTQTLRDVLRRESAGGLSPRIEIVAGRGRISVEATTPEGRSRNNLKLRTQVIGPDLSTTEITLDQTGAGQYEGSFPAVARGAYLVSVNEVDAQNGTTAGAVNSYSPEFNISSQDANLLARLSEITGGKVIGSGGREALDLFSGRSTRTIPHEIWQTLMLAVLILIPIDVGVRRVAISREQAAQVRAWLNARLHRRSRSTIDSASIASMGKLKDARSRVVLSDDRNMDKTPATISLSEKGDREPTKVSSSEKVEAAEPLASRLLDARRKRRE
jgi:hypothetical protein